jgi:hypothetical protein
MTGRMGRLIPVMRQRMSRSRLALARLGRAVAQARARRQQLETARNGVAERLVACRAARFANGMPTIAVLTGLEEQMGTLRAACTHLAALERQVQAVLEELLSRQRVAAREWRRSETRLEYVVALGLTDRRSSDARACELEDELHVETRAAMSRG